MKKLFLLPIMLISGMLIMISCEEKEEKIPETIELDMNVTHASAYNATDGAISITVLKGEPPYIYEWNTGDTTSSITGVGAGEYSVTITYGKNGIAFYQTTAAITQPEAVPLSLEFDVTDSDKYGKPNGSIEVNVSGGVPPYNFLWSNGSTEAIASELTAGVYQVTVTDSGNPFSITTTGTASVGQPAFVCGSDSIMDIDGNLYSTIIIGEQCWLGENLRTTHRPDSPVTELVPIDGRLCRGLFCENIEGAHYTWEATMNGSAAATLSDEKIQGICPTGWHLPTREDFEALDAWLSVDGNGGPGFFSGAKMKGEGSSSGFDALFTGNWGFGIYNNAPYASYWTSSESVTSTKNARMIYITQDTPFMNAANQPKGYGMNVRCMKDEDLP